MWYRVCGEVLHSKDGAMKSRKYIVFEAGSRAGLSAEVFFRAWRKQNGWEDGKGDVLYLADFTSEVIIDVQGKAVIFADVLCYEGEYIINGFSLVIADILRKIGVA